MQISLVIIHGMLAIGTCMMVSGLTITNVGYYEVFRTMYSTIRSGDIHGLSSPSTLPCMCCFSTVLPLYTPCNHYRNNAILTLNFVHNLFANLIVLRKPTH
jgi:hypothetical protein